MNPILGVQQLMAGMFEKHTSDNQQIIKSVVFCESDDQHKDHSSARECSLK